MCMCVFVSVHVHVCLLALSPSLCPEAFLLTRKARKAKKLAMKQKVRDILDELWTSSTRPHLLKHTHTLRLSLCSLSQLSPLSLSLLRYFSPPPSVIAFDLNTSIKANLTRQRKVTYTQGGQGEVAFVAWGSASDPEDCGQWFPLDLRRLWMFRSTHIQLYASSG